jgi:predicted Rossmann fold flavoprotein
LARHIHTLYNRTHGAILNTYDVIVVGGGASGMFAAGRAAERGLNVLLIEKNKRLGEKLRITGGGRCNITNAEFDNRILLKNYGKAEPFLYSLFTQYSVKDTFEFFESRNLPLLVEARKRAFPASHKATDVVAVLESYLKQTSVNLALGTPVKKISIEGGKVISVTCGSTTYQASYFIFSTGSVSHPETGSTGDGFGWLRQAGHKVVDPTPDIVPLASSASWVHDISGTTLTDVKVTFFCEGEKKFSLVGNVLCTHFGLSGPLILNSARKVADLLQSGLVKAHIDLFPKLDLGALQRHILAQFDDNKNKTLKNILGSLAPNGARKGIQTELEQKIDLETKVHSVSKTDRKILAETLKTMPVTIDGLMGFDRAVIADGGLALEEIDFKAMRSRKIENLHVTGDLLHVNRPSGGYSLQLCWSSGYVAGNSVGRS